jgi:hypothetical protein
MSKPESSANEAMAGENDAAEHFAHLADGRKASRKLALAVTVTCPNCSVANKPEWLNKSRNSDSYATTMFCEQCGSLLAIWAIHVGAQVVAQKSG